MTNTLLFSQISLLPETLKKEVADFVAFLLQKKDKDNRTVKNASSVVQKTS